MTHTRSLSKSTWIAAGAALSISAIAPRADACGGFFCSRSPVDQTAEHILFTVNDDQTVTAYVQIKYVGDKDGFAWIVPAPGIPKLNTDLPDAALRALDTGTEPQYFKGCGARGVLNGAVPTLAPGAATEDSGHGVTVLATQAVGPFNTVTLEATDADVLVEWLQENDYRITEKMIPLLQPYVEGGMHFVAVKLQANKDVSDIQPMGMTYEGNKPMIPIRLTAAAAQPEMGIVTFILSNRRWAPENYIDLKIPDHLIQFDQYGFQNNYLTLLSSETDKVGGQAFVTEYAKATKDLVTQIMQQPVPSPDAMKARDALLPILQKFPYITRLHARMSAEEMTDDPVFMVASDRSDVNNIHDLSDPGSTCNYPPNPPPVDPCNFNYCGRRGVCVQAEADAAQTGVATAPACACANDAIARVTTTGANGQPTMYCEPVAMNLDGAPAGGGETLLSAACEGFSCGDHGACVPMNGNPTCQCEGGYAAVVGTTVDQTGNATTGVTCQRVKGTIPALPRLPSVGSAMLTPGKTVTAGGSSGGGCNVAPGRRGNALLAFAAALGLALTARRRYHRPA
jgi:hypothetical protein